MSRIKTASTIVAFPRGKEITVYNYLTKDAVTCAPQDVYWLTVAADWTSVDELIELHPHVSREEILTTLDTLIHAGMLVSEDTANATKDTQYNLHWGLGPTSAAFHFTTSNMDFMNLDESVAAQKQKFASEPSPQLFWRNGSKVVDLLPTTFTDTSPLLSVMRRRRTQRDVQNENISLTDLAGLLYAGLGIVGFVKTETAVLPLKMTPSGGARNPYEAFVWVRAVEGLQSGIYHYSALENSIEKLKDAPNLLPSDVLKGQDWADNMSAVVFLVAVLGRTSWKYTDDNAYKVVLIEAGHIGQNIMLQCTEAGLTACPTAALDHDVISDILGLESITQFPVYALLVGRPKPGGDLVYPISEYESLERKLVHELQGC